MSTGGRHNVPVIMQMEATECGAASLAMILAYYGRWLPLSRLRYECGVSRDGSSLQNISKAAKNFGLEIKAYKVEPEELNYIQLPVIAHWDFCHFVVITGIKRNTIYVNDPARGRIKVSLEEANKSMTGVVMLLKPGPDFVRGGHKASILGFVRERLKGSGEALLFTFLTGFIMSVAGLFMPLLNQIFADDILTRRSPEWFGPFLLIFGLLIMIQVGVQVISGILSRAFSMKLSISGNTSFLWHLLKLPMRFFNQHSPGDLVTRMGSAASIASSLVSQLAPVATNLALLIIYLVAMLRYNLVLAGIAAFVTIMDLLLVRLVAEKQVDMIRVNERNSGRLIGTTIASLSNIESIKAAGAEKAFFKRWAGQFVASNNATIRMNKTLAYISSLPQILQTLGNTAVLGMGVWYIIQGRMTIGMLMAFQSLMNSFLGASSKASGTINNLLTMRANMERMEDVYRAETDRAISQKDPDAQSLGGKLKGHLEMRHVSFGYNRLEPPLINDFNLVLEPGKSVAFVGATGCGKSTLAKIIAGINLPSEGEVLYDGLPLSKIQRSTFVNSIAIIEQEQVIFQGTVADNVKMWDKTIEDFAMILACYQAQIHYEIASRPEAYDTPLKEGGSNFSTGQCQRMEIANALVREPSILVMDEATSALDSLSESAVMQAIKDMGISLVIVAHRLSTIRDCDEIIALDKGQVIERGTHEELMARKGYYYELMTVNSGGLK